MLNYPHIPLNLLFQLLSSVFVYLQRSVNTISCKIFYLYPIEHPCPLVASLRSHCPSFGKPQSASASVSWPVLSMSRQWNCNVRTSVTGLQLTVSPRFLHAVMCVCTVLPFKTEEHSCLDMPSLIHPVISK